MSPIHVYDEWMDNGMLYNYIETYQFDLLLYILNSEPFRACIYKLIKNSCHEEYRVTGIGYHSTAMDYKVIDRT